MTIDETITESCVELLKQYIQLKVASDLEEVSMVTRILKRVAAKSHLWTIVEHFTAPFIQVSFVPHTCCLVYWFHVKEADLWARKICSEPNSNLFA